MYLFKNHKVLLCSLTKEQHKFKKKCSLNKEPGILCNEDCSLKVGHEGDCVCSRGRGSHICNQICSFYNQADGCQQFCNLNIGHVDSHNCRGNHKCKVTCYLNGITRGCNNVCSLSYPHQGNCICNKKEIIIIAKKIVL